MQLIIITLLNVAIHAIDTAAYAARLAGVRTRRPATAASLYNILALSARGANTLQGLLIGALTDLTVLRGGTAALLANYRIILLGTTIGAIIGGLLLPTVSRILERGVASYQWRGSVPRVIIRGITPRGLAHIRQEAMPPRISVLRESRRSPFSPRFLSASILVTAVYTVGNFAALYASAVVPEGARTAANLAPLITSIGVLLNYLCIAPTAALVNDEALRGERPLKDVTYITIWQIGAQVLGTVLAQALLWPAGAALASITRWLLG